MHRARASVFLALVTALLGLPALADQSPTVTAPELVEAAEGDSLQFTVTASDPDGDLLTGLGALSLPPRAVFDVNVAAQRGTFRWLPDYDEAGFYTVVFFAENAIQGLSYTTILVDNTDRPPVVTVPTIVYGVEAEPLEIIAATAVDPDGDPIQSFVPANLPEGSTFTSNRTHTSLRIFWTPLSGQAGDHAVTLTAVNVPLVDAPMAGSATVTISIAPGRFPARAYVLKKEQVIRLASAGKACIQIETVNSTFDVARVDPSKVILTRPGSTDGISAMDADVVKTDLDHNGIPDVTVCFAKADLRRLFGDYPGYSVRAALNGVLHGGSVFDATVDLKVLTSGGPVFLISNPGLSGSALSFTTHASGRARLDLFDIRGRLVRTVLEDPALPAGFHDVSIVSGTGGRSAGVYFYKLETVDGSYRGKVVLVK